MLSRKIKLKSLHVFMTMILLLGLLQPGLVFAADSTNVEDGNTEIIVEEVEESVEAGETLVEEVEVSVEEEPVEPEITEETETPKESEKDEEAEIFDVNKDAIQENDSAVEENSNSNDEALEASILNVDDDIEQLSESDMELLENGDVVVTDAYLTINTLNETNNEAELVLNTSHAASLTHINVYDIEGDLQGYLRDDSVNNATLHPGENYLSFTANYCPSLATPNDCVFNNYDLPDGEYNLEIRIADENGYIENTHVGPLFVDTTASEPEIEFDFELVPERISQWELARGGVEFRLDAPNGRDATLTVGDQSFEFETRYLHQDMLSVDLSPGTYDVKVTIGNTTETEQLVVISNEEYYGDDPESNPILESREMVLTKSEAEEIETIRVFADYLHEHTSIDVLVNGEHVQTFYHDWGSASAEIEVGQLPIGAYTIEFVHPTGKAEITLFIVPDDHGALAPAGTYEGSTIQYMGGSNMLETPFELPIKFEVDGNGIIKNLEVEYWWVCVLADGQSGFSDSVEMPDTQITVNQPFQINWDEGASPQSLVGIIHEDGTASGTFFSHSLGCGTSASNWNLTSDTQPDPKDPEPTEPEDFEVELDLDTTEETEGPVTITVATTSDSDITSLKWLAGDRTADDFADAGNEIDLESKSFTVDENGPYTIYALNADGVVALSTIGVTNIVEPDPTDPDPTEPEDFEVELDLDTTEETEGPVTITIATTSDFDITSLKWLTGDRTEADFADAGNDIDLETKSFTVEENGTYTIFASNAEGVVALSTIEVSNIVEPDPIAPDPTDPEPTDPEPTDPEPTDPEPTDPEPTDPEPSDQGDGTDPGVSIDPSDDNDAEGNKLPITSTNLFNLLVIGTIIFMIGFALLMFRRKQNA